MAVQDKKVAVLVYDLFEQSEFEYPVNALKAAGVAVTVISASGNKNIQGMKHADKGRAFVADMLLNDADAVYDALVLPGGALNADKLRMDETARMWAANFMEDDKPLAAICHAPWLLVSADVVDGRKLTSYYTIQDDIMNAGGDWVDQEVVVDGKLITSRKPEDLPAFTKAILEKLD